MSWLADGRFISDLQQDGTPFVSGADVPDLGKKLEQL